MKSHSNTKHNTINQNQIAAINIRKKTGLTWSFEGSTVNNLFSPMSFELSMAGYLYNFLHSRNQRTKWRDNFFLFFQRRNQPNSLYFFIIISINKKFSQMCTPSFVFCLSTHTHAHRVRIP